MRSSILNFSLESVLRYHMKWAQSIISPSQWPFKTEPQDRLWLRSNRSSFCRISLEHQLHTRNCPQKNFSNRTFKHFYLSDSISYYSRRLYWRISSNLLSLCSSKLGRSLPTCVCKGNILFMNCSVLSQSACNC